MMQVHTIFRLVKWALGLIAAGAMFAVATADDAPSHASPMARIQRRAADEARAAVNETGEITYSVESVQSAPGAVLRVGTSDSGTVVVSDPWALHIAPRRRLDPSEYSVTPSAGASIDADGVWCLAFGVASGAVTNTLTIRPVDPATALSGATFQQRSLGGGAGRAEVTEGEAVIRAVVKPETVPGIVDPSGTEPGYCYVSNIAVWAWAGERRSVVYDTSIHDLAWRDDWGETSLGGLRTWVAERYDGRTAEHWSGWPAINTVRLAGQSVMWSAGGALRSSVDSGTWTYYAGGVPVIEISSGVSTNSATSELDITDIKVGSDAAVIDVSASLGVPVYIDTCDSLAAPEWSRAAGQTSTYPATVTSRKGQSAYRVTIPIDPEATAVFYRSSASVPGGAARALRLGGDATPIYIHGERAVWTNIVVGGATIRVLAAQPD